MCGPVIGITEIGLIEIQVLWPHWDLLNQNLHFNEVILHAHFSLRSRAISYS